MPSRTHHHKAAEREALGNSGALGDLESAHLTSNIQIQITLKLLPEVQYIQQNMRRLKYYYNL